MIFITLFYQSFSTAKLKTFIITINDKRQEKQKKRLFTIQLKDTSIGVSFNCQFHISDSGVKPRHPVTLAKRLARPPAR